MDYNLLAASTNRAGQATRLHQTGSRKR